MEKSVHFEIQEEKYVNETACRCKLEDCDKCDPDYEPDLEDIEEETDSEYESDYDSTDTMDEVYEECGLSRAEKKILQDELMDLIAEAESASRYPQ